MDYIFKALGAIGIVFITVGILRKNKVEEIVYLIIGGVLLEIYSIYIGDTVFIVLQMVFILSAVLEIFKISKNKK